MMKTKFLLSAIVLPLAFAACTSEDVIEAGNGQIANIEGRAALADITFVAGDVDSRLTTDGNGKWTWEDTDKFSAHLIDAAKFSVATTDTALYTNYIYTKGTEGYTTTSQMVEGMYWFYAPANEDKNDREMMKFALPTEQTMDVEDPDAHIVENSVFFSPVYKMEAKNNEANVTVPLEMYNWYTVALIPFTNDTKDDLEIQKIVLKTANSLAGDGKINAGAIAQKFLKVYDADEEAWVDYTNADGDVLSETPMAESYNYNTGDDKVFILNVEKTLAPKETFTAKMLVPAGNAGLCTVTIVYADGEGSTFSTTSMQFNHHAQKAIFGVSNGKPNAKKIQASNIGAVVDNYVMSNEDIINYLAENHAEDILLSQIGTWNINADALAAIAANSGDVEFDKDITIENETAKKITLTGLNNNVTLKGGKFALAAYGHDVTVEAGELELTDAGAYGTITNNGGKITINKTITAEGIYNNEGELVFAANNTVSSSAIAALTNGKYTSDTDYKKGKITINANKTLTVGDGKTVLAVKNSEVEVNGSIEIRSAEGGARTLNEGTITVAAGADILSNGLFHNYGTINNSGEVTDVINYKSIKNEAATARVTFAHDGTTEGVNPAGTIDNTVLAFVDENNYGTGGEHAQTIFYEVTTAADNATLAAVDKSIAGYGINTLKFSAAVSLNGRLVDANGKDVEFRDVNKLIFASGSSLKLGNGTLQNLNVNDIDVESAVTFAGYDVAKSAIGFTKDVNINVAYNATLTVSHMTLAGVTSVDEDAIASAKINFNLASKATSATYTSWGCVKNNGEIKLNGGEITDGTNTIAEEDLVDEATTSRGANWIGKYAVSEGVAVTVTNGKISWN